MRQNIRAVEYMECSAKTQKGLNAVFNQAIQTVICGEKSKDSKTFYEKILDIFPTLPKTEPKKVTNEGECAVNCSKTKKKSPSLNEKLNRHKFNVLFSSPN
jgi:hypothetical protein